MQDKDRMATLHRVAMASMRTKSAKEIPSEAALRRMQVELAIRELELQIRQVLRPIKLTFSIW